MADSCGSYVSADDLKAAKQSIQHIEHVATSKDSNGNPALVVTDTIRGVGYTNATLDGLFSDIGFKPVNGSFEDGATLTNRWEVLQYESDGSFYQWTGTLPKVVPAGSTPASTGGIGSGAWVDQTDLTLRSQLSMVGAAFIDPSRIKASPFGNLSQLIQFVTPEQFGAIGDGTVHPLSERYSTLAAAQSNYPHVTSLTQSIDWAACQAAENFAVGKTVVKVKPYAVYHFGHDGLLIDQYSQWEGVTPTSQELKVTEFRKSFPVTTPVFQQDYIVRVRPGNNDGGYEYKAGIRFVGIRLKYDVARRYPTKGTNTICLHVGNMIKGELDVSCWGGEYGVYTWIHWGNKGHIRIDNCHKGYWSVPNMGDNERSGGGTTTSNYYRIECDVTPFPITLGNAHYSEYTGFFEGCVATDGNYDSVNETACGITFIGEIDDISFHMGIERWEGVHVTKTGSGSTANASFKFGFFADGHYLMSTGNDGSDAAIRNINGTTVSKISLPPATRSYWNGLVANGRCVFNIHDAYYYLGHIDKEISSTRYLMNFLDPNSCINFIGGQVGFVPEANMAPVSFSPTEANKALVTVVGCRAMELFCSPNTSYKLTGKNEWTSINTIAKTGIIDPSNGQYADFTPPSLTYRVTGLDGLWSNAGTSGAAIGQRPSILSYDSSTKALRVASTNSSVALTFNAFVKLSIM